MSHAGAIVGKAEYRGLITVEERDEEGRQASKQAGRQAGKKSKVSQ